MSNGARHTWGFFAGVVLTAALAGSLIFGSYRLQHGYLTQFHHQDKWIGGGLLVGAAVIFGILVASRLSPLASLVGGVALTAAGVLFFFSQKTTTDLVNRFPFKAERVTLAGLEEEGFILFAGVGLLFSSLFPSRWRGGDDDEIVGPEYSVPTSRDTYGDRDAYQPPAPANDPLAYPMGDQRPTDQSPYASPHGSYQGYETQQAQPQYAQPHQPQQPQQPQQANYEQANYERAGYDAPLYEPTRQQQQYGRSPFDPPPEDGGTREMPRPD
jgi:hypothetical protein